MSLNTDRLKMKHLFFWGIVLVLLQYFSTYFFGFATANSLSSALSKGTGIRFWHYIAIISFFAVSLVSLIIYPYFTGKTFGKKGWLSGLIWSIFLFASLTIFGRLLPFYKLLDKQELEILSSLTGNTSLGLRGAFELFVLPSISGWLGGLTVKEKVKQRN